MQEDVILAGKRLWKALVISKIKDDGGNITENTEPAIHTSQYIYLCMYLFIYLSSFDSFMLLYRNHQHLPIVLEIQLLHPSTSVLNRTV